MKFFNVLKKKWYNKKLVRKYPFLRLRNVFTGKIVPHTNITWLDMMPKGWRDAFGLRMCKEIKKELVKHNYLHKYRITDIKEKYGTLRWYDNGFVGNVDRIILKYEDLSMCYCQFCGKPTKYYSKGWITYLCEDCKNEQVASGTDESSFIMLKKADVPSHIFYNYDNQQQGKAYIFDEVAQLVEDNWED